MKLPKVSLITAFHGYLQPTSSTIIIMRNKFSRYLHENIRNQAVSVHPNITKIKQRHLNNRHYCSTKIEDPDEFRAREEKKEEEFSKQSTESSYESKNKEQENDIKLNLIRMKILEASMPFVGTYGWSRTSISHGGEQVGYSNKLIHGIFPDGGIELIRYFYSKCNQELFDILLKETNNGELQIKEPAEFLINAVKIRLKMIEPYINQWPKALAKMALPQNVPKSLAQLLILIDDIWFFGGDKSVDIGWYTRRVGLAAIYKMTELHMLQDKSVDYQATWEFLRKRINEATLIQEFFVGSDQSFPCPKRLKSTFETARNMLGLSYNRR